MAIIGQHRTPGWFTLIAVLLILWGGMGCFACIQQFRLGVDSFPDATEYDRRFFATLPSWYNYVYAVATGAGLLGAIALLLRSAIARPLFIVSLVAVIAQFGWTFAATDIIAAKGLLVATGFPIFIALVAAFEVWFAGYARQRGWMS